MTYFINTEDTRFDFVDAVNRGEVTEVQGHEVWSQFGPAATTWQNGSVSVNVRGRNRRTQGVVWIKDRRTISYC